MSLSKKSSESKSIEQSKLEQMIESIKEMSDSFGDKSQQVIALISAAHRTLKDRAIENNPDLLNIPAGDIVVVGDTTFSAWGYDFKLEITQQEKSPLEKLADALGLDQSAIEDAKKKAMLRHHAECDCEGAKRWRKENGYPEPGEKGTTH